MKSPILIVNADDFGLSRSINRGILECHRDGIVNSASLMVNMPGFEHALSCLKEHPRLTVGIHVNLLRGEPLCGEYPHGVPQSLDGRQRPSLACMTRSVVLDGYLHGARWVERETRAQIEYALSHGVSIAHLDSERNIHMIPALFKLFARLASDYNIPRLRIIDEEIFYRHNSTGVAATGIARSLTRRFFSLAAPPNRLCARKHGITVNDHYFGFQEAGSLSLFRLESILRDLPRGTTEIACHPGYIDEEWYSYPLSNEEFYLTDGRALEVALLKHPTLTELVARVS